MVIAPIHKQSINTVELYSIKGDVRINKYTPAVTIVAACINAETGVGVYVDIYINKYTQILSYLFGLYLHLFMLYKVSQSLFMIEKEFHM